MEENNPLLGVNPVFKSFLQLLILIGLYTIFAVLAVSLGVKATYLFVGVEIPKDLSIIDYTSLDAKAILGHKIFQTIASIGIFVITALVYVRFFAKEKFTTFFGFRKVLPPAKLFGLVLVIAFSAIPVISAILIFNKQLPLPVSIEETAQQLQATNEGFTLAFLKASSIGMLLLNLFVMAVVPAVGEELLFRGAFMKLLHRFFKENIHLAIVVTAILFSIMHLQYYNFFAIVFMGIIFGYIYYWSGNIMVAIWAHFINNGTTVLFAYLAESNPEVEMLAMDYQFSPLVTIISAIVLAGAIYMFYKASKQYHAVEEAEETIEEE